MKPVSIGLGASMVNLFQLVADGNMDFSDSIKEVHVKTFTKSDGISIPFRELPLKSVQKHEVHRMFSVGGLGCITLEIAPERGVMKLSGSLALKDVTMNVEIETENLNRRA